MKQTFFIFKLLFLMALTSTLSAQTKNEVIKSDEHTFKIENLIEQQGTIWGFDFLSDGRIIYSERQGQLKIFDPKTKKTIDVQGAPAVWANGQGGLLDIRVHPTHKNQIFMTYSEPIGDKATTALASATLSDHKLTAFKKLFSASEANDNQVHFGSRIEFDGQGHVFITVGDRDKRENAQNLKYHTGKIIRLNEDGTVPSDNPFIKQKNVRPEIYSLGHRSPQGLVRNSTTGDLWEAEMGPKGGDELNIIKPGANYGWPEATYGREYSGPKIGETTQAGMESPIAYWVPSISPSGITIYTGDAFPKWKGNIFVGTLSGQHLRRLVLDGQKVLKQEELLKDQSLRFRNVRTGTDGFLYFSTDSGKIARLVPAK